MKMKTMIFKACRWPIFFMMICFGLLALMFFLSSLGDGSNVLSAVFKVILPILNYVSLASLVLFVVTASAVMYRLWKWDRGWIEVVCRHCCGLMNYKPDGRYGPYYKCLACNLNQKA